MKRAHLALAACTALGLASSAYGSLISDFTGDYDVSNWTVSKTGPGGKVDLTEAPVSVTLTGSDESSEQWRNVDFTTQATGAGTVAFTWDFWTLDSGDASYDPFGFLLNGVFVQLTSDEDDDTQSGRASFEVAAGDAFGFRQASLDDLYGAGITRISQFSAPTATVPAPATVTLLGAGLLLLGTTGLLRRRRAAPCEPGGQP